MPALARVSCPGLRFLSMPALPMICCVCVVNERLRPCGAREPAELGAVATFRSSIIRIGPEAEQESVSLSLSDLGRLVTPYL